MIRRPFATARQSRRSFLKLGTAGIAGLSLADVLRAEAAAATPRSQRIGPARSGSEAASRSKATSVILLWLGGGPATIDMWDLKPHAPEEIRGEFSLVATTAPGVEICEHLPQTANVMRCCTLVRSLEHSIPAHGPGTQYMMTGNKPSPALEYPSLGSLAARLLPPGKGVPAYVSFERRSSAGAGYLGAAYNPFEVLGGDPRRAARAQNVTLPDGFTPGDLDDRARLRAAFDRQFQRFDDARTAASLNKFQQQALDILRSNKVGKAFDLSGEPAGLRERYGRSQFGRNVLVARRLIEAGVRFVTVGLSGWDTHSGNFAALRTRLLPRLDAALAALVGDLDERGLLDETIVYCAGEFGRTPQINRAAGRDHWARSMSVLLAGGGFRKGYAHGATDGEGGRPVDSPCSPDDLSGTIFAALGIEPHREVTSTTGRPIAIFREGEVIRELLSA